MLFERIFSNMNYMLFEEFFIKTFILFERFLSINILILLKIFKTFILFKIRKLLIFSQHKYVFKPVIHFIPHEQFFEHLNLL